MQLLRRFPTESRPYAKAAALGTLARGIVAGSVLPFAGVLARRLGSGPWQLALLTMAPFIGFFLAAPASRLAFRFRWGKVSGFFQLAIRFIQIGFLFVGSAGAFVALLVGVRVLDGCDTALATSMLKAQLPEHLRAWTLKWLRVLVVAISVPASWVAGRYLDLPGATHRVLFPICGALTLWAIVPMFGVPAAPDERRAHGDRCGPLEEWRVLFRDRHFAAFEAAFFVGTLAEKIGMPVTPIYFADVLDLGYEQIALASGIVGPAMAVAGYLFWGARLRRISPLTVVLAGMFLKSIRPMLWALATVFPAPLAFVVAGEGVFRFMVCAIEMGSLMAVMSMSRRGHTPVYMGVHCAFIGVRGIVGPVIGVWLLRAGVPVPWIYWLIAAIVLLGGFALIPIHARRHRSLPPPEAGPAA